MSVRNLSLLVLFTLSLCVPCAYAKSDKKADLKVGDKAPQFAGMDDENEKWDSKEKAGKKIYVVYFYPADMTPGCTMQACAYRDAVKELKRKDVEIVGVSGDSVENHKHFKNEYELNFTLLADPDGKIAEAFGVSTRKGGSFQKAIGDEKTKVTFDRGVTASRWTFVIDKDWKIAHKDTKVNAPKDSDKVLKVIDELK